MLNDDELIEKIKLGNEQAAEELITRYYKSILRNRHIASTFQK